MSDMTIRPSMPQAPLPGMGEVQDTQATAEVTGQPRLGEADPASLPSAARKDQAPARLPIDPPKADQTPPAELAKTLATIGDPTTADIYTVMALFQQMAQESRNQARADRHASMDAQVQAMSDAADKMREAAAHRLVAGIVQGAFQIGAGIAQGIGAGMSLGYTGNQAQMQAINGLGQSVGQGITGAGGIVAAGFNYAASMADAEKVVADSRATVAGHQYDQANDLMQQMRDIIRDIQGKLSAMEQSTHDTVKSITRA